VSPNYSRISGQMKLRAALIVIVSVMGLVGGTGAALAAPTSNAGSRPTPAPSVLPGRPVPRGPVHVHDNPCACFGLHPQEVQGSLMEFYQNTTYGTWLHIWHNDGTTNQFWVQVHCFSSTFCDMQNQWYAKDTADIDDYSSQLVDGNKLQVWHWDNTGAQEWTLPGTGIGNGTYYMQLWDGNSNWCADNYYGIATNGNRIKLHSCNGDINQQWGAQLP